MIPLYQKSAAILLLGIGLAACQHRPPEIEADGSTRTGKWRSDSAYFQQSAARLASLTQWRYAAKVGLTTASLKEQANLVWRFGDQANEVNLFGPLGVGALKLEFDQYGVQLSDNKGALHSGDSAEALMLDIVGWPLPVDALSYWLFVMPAPGHPFQFQLNGDGQIRTIRQLGWQIDFDDYRPYSDRLLPRKLTARKKFNKPGLGAVAVRLITKSWEW